MKKILLNVFVFVIGILWTSTVEATNVPKVKPIFLSCSPYRVTFQLVKSMNRFYDIQTRVACGGQMIHLNTQWHAESYEEAVKDLKKLTGVKDGYLFTPWSCGGGNAWRCEMEYVISCDRGLQVLGALGRHVDWENPGESLKDGLFRDGFDGLEINPFTCHAAAPSFELFLMRENGSFVVAKDPTWRNNTAVMVNFQMRFRAGIGKGETEEEAKSAFLGALVLAMLCGQKTEWGSTLRTGQEIFGRAKAKAMADYVVKTLSKYRPARIPQ
jgi:hypothetical protein